MTRAESEQILAELKSARLQIQNQEEQLRAQERAAEDTGFRGATHDDIYGVSDDDQDGEDEGEEDLNNNDDEDVKNFF